MVRRSRTWWPSAVSGLAGGTAVTLAGALLHTLVSAVPFLPIAIAQVLVRTTPGRFDSFFIDDHVPQTYQDTPWGHRGRAFANGYIQALIEAVTKQRQAAGIAPGISPGSPMS